MKYITYKELCECFRKFNDEKYPNKGLRGFVVFTEDSFKDYYSEKSRTYTFGSDNKAFCNWMGGYSIFASCLDGTDSCLRLEGFMADERGGRNGWRIEKCWVTDPDGNDFDVKKFLLK